MLGMQTDMGDSGGVVGVRDTQSAIGLLEAKNEPSQPRAIFSWCRLRNVRKSVDFPLFVQVSDVSAEKALSGKTRGRARALYLIHHRTTAEQRIKSGSSVFEKTLTDLAAGFDVLCLPAGV